MPALRAGLACVTSNPVCPRCGGPSIKRGLYEGTQQYGCKGECGRMFGERSRGINYPRCPRCGGQSLKAGRRFGRDQRYHCQGPCGKRFDLNTKPGIEPPNPNCPRCSRPSKKDGHAGGFKDTNAKALSVAEGSLVSTKNESRAERNGRHSPRAVRIAQGRAEATA
jgi:transposase-like protein